MDLVPTHFQKVPTVGGDTPPIYQYMLTTFKKKIPHPLYCNYYILWQNWIWFRAKFVRRKWLEIIFGVKEYNKLFFLV